MRVALCYNKEGSPKYGLGHVGMGGTCRQNAYVLRNVGCLAEVWPIAGGDALEKRLLEEELTKNDPVTHAVIGAPYIPVAWMQRLCQRFPKIIFAVVSHSNVGFLQAESAAIRLMRGNSDLQMEEFNFHAAGNCHRLVEDFDVTYGRSLTYLPNMYDLSSVHLPPCPRTFTGGPLRIGSFGALRVQKNFTCAAWAAMAIARHFRVPLEFYINTGRDDNNGRVVYNAVKASTESVHNVSLVEAGWESPMAFRKLVQTMHLLIQPSYSETFSMVTADAIAEGTPVVVSDAIDWAPSYWVAQTDSVADIAKVGVRLVTDVRAATDGLAALKKHNKLALLEWKEFLKWN